MRYANRASFLNQIKQAISLGSPARVYWVAIANDYERSQIFREILRYVQTPDRFLLRMSGAELDLTALSNHLETPSLLDGEPIALIDEVECLNKAENTSLEPLLRRSFGYIILGSRAKSPLSESAEAEGVTLDLLAEKPWEREKRIEQQLSKAVSVAGKTISREALSHLMDRFDVDAGVLEREIDKLICYCHANITETDVKAICSSNKAFAIWQTAEEIVWEKSGALNADFFHPLIPALRSQLQLGLKIASLLTSDASREEWAEALPKVYPKTLEKRTAAAGQLGARYFARGLKALFDIELRSRTGSGQYGALLDFFRCQLYSL